MSPLLTDDASGEGLVRDAKESKFGTIFATDEVTKFFSGGGAAERTEALLGAYDCSLSRKSTMTNADAKSTTVICSLIGATTTARYSELKMDDGSGKSGRSIIAYEANAAKAGPRIEGAAESATRLLEALTDVRTLEAPSEIGYAVNGKDLIERTFTDIRMSSESYSGAIQDGVRGANGLIYRMAAGIEMLTVAAGTRRKVGLVSYASAKAAVEIYTGHCMPSLITLSNRGGKDENSNVGVVHQFVCILIDRLKVVQIGKRDLARNRRGLDLRGMTFADFVTLLEAAGVATVEQIKSSTGAGAPEKTIVLNPEFVAAFKARRLENQAS